MAPVIGLDGDDTLWHNEDRFTETHAWLAELLAPYHPDPDQHLYEVERRNLALFGYGAKGFTLSMIETAIEVSGGDIPASAIHRIVEKGRELLARPAELLDGVAETIAELAGSHRLLLVTKGDLLNQEAKVASSGLADWFEGVEIVSEKDPATYRRLLTARSIDPADFVMVGNSLRSDVLPVIDIGGIGIHIPYQVTWVMETVEATEADLHIYETLDTIRALPEAIARVAS